MSEPWAINAGKASTAIGTATIASATNLLTIVGHGLGDGDTVTVDTLTGGGSALTADAVYFVRDATTDDFALSLTLHGPQVEFSTDGGADVYHFAPQYSATELRRAFGGLMQHGRVDSLTGADANHTDRLGAKQGMMPIFGSDSVSVSGTTWTVIDGVYVIFPAENDMAGPYIVGFEGDSGSLDPADGSNPRLDALDLQIQDDDEDASGFRWVRVVYTAGTPGADPAEPSATTGALRVGVILVPAGGSPSPSVSRQSPLTVARGGIIPLRTLAERPEANRYAGMAVWDIDEQVMQVNLDGSGSWANVAGPGVFPEAKQDTEAGQFTFTGTSPGVSTAGGTYADCGTDFVAPASGRVMIYTNAAIDITESTAAVAFVAPVVREGGTVGSGSSVMGADDERSVRTGGGPAGQSSRDRQGVSHLLSGLTPGDTYNVRLEHWVTSQTGTLFDRSVQVVPAP